MYRTFSKPSGDIKTESSSIASRDAELQNIVKTVTPYLKQCSLRKSCIVCNTKVLSQPPFVHRGVDLLACHKCGHIQTKRKPNDSYRLRVNRALSYGEIYPETTIEGYTSRIERVYEPKVNWLLDCLDYNKIKYEHLNWCDVGCGSGMLLSSLQGKGIKNITGFDSDDHSIEIARRMLGKGIVNKSHGAVSEVIANVDADIYTAFFVLEHVEENFRTIEALKRKKPGTVFAFAVPVFGFITMFESVLENHYPRCLDAMLHTQIFSDESIKYFLNTAGYEVSGEWIFGQDVSDLSRFLAANLSDCYPQEMLEKMLSKFNSVVDPLQCIVDKNYFSDSRHILAVKR